MFKSIPPHSIRVYCACHFSWRATDFTSTKNENSNKTLYFCFGDIRLRQFLYRVCRFDYSVIIVSSSSRKSSKFQSHFLIHVGVFQLYQKSLVVVSKSPSIHSEFFMNWACAFSENFCSNEEDSVAVLVWILDVLIMCGLWNSFLWSVTSARGHFP